MTRMRRKQIYITVEQDNELKEEAKERGITESEVIRERIANKPVNAIKKPRDLSSWEEEKEYIRERMKIQVPQRPRTWTRDELYDRD